ncbi:MAG: GGDEF domain-containing protein [Candidatus Aadella gelida]|nr:GGDEF domain-containing protein [Candidatus Aadella gelida]
MKFLLFKKKTVTLLVVVSLLGTVFFNYFISHQNKMMYQQITPRDPVYHVIGSFVSSSICNKFADKAAGSSLEEIELLLTDHNRNPTFLLDFVYEAKSGKMKSLLYETNESEMIRAEKVFPVKYGNNQKGKLLVYDMNKQMEKRFNEYTRVTTIVRLTFTIILLLLLSIFVFLKHASSLKEQKKIVESQKRLAINKSKRDASTGLYTQKFFKELVQENIEKGFKEDCPAALIMCDIDHFKQFNDTHGHLAGDKVLATVARIIGENVRYYDLVSRYGGEEFAVLLTGTRRQETPEANAGDILDVAITTAQRIRKVTEETPIQFDGKTLKVTISLGVSIYELWKDFSADQFIKNSDLALYKSKENGRNCIHHYMPATDQYNKYV